MSPVDLNFTIFTYFGIWRPQKWRSGGKFWLYNFYTVTVLFLVLSMPLAQIIKFVGSFDSKENPLGSIPMMMTLIAACGKILTMLGYRQRIIKLLETLGDGICRAKNSREENVLQNSNRLIRFRTKVCGLSILVTMVSMTVTICFTMIPKKTLPYKIWLPFNINTGSLYGLVLIVEYTCMFIGGVVAIAYDTLVPAVILQTCAQFKLLKQRLQDISAISDEAKKENGLECSNAEQEKISKDQIVDCVRHQLLIYELADEANHIFGMATLLKVLTTTTTLCMSVYRMSRIKGFNIQLVTLFIYSFSTSLQIFLLSYAGSELNDESQGISEGIYDTEWYKLNESNKKSMLIMMSRSSRPMIFIVGKIFYVANDFFVKLVQFAYSSYTVLKQMST